MVRAGWTMIFHPSRKDPNLFLTACLNYTFLPLVLGLVISPVPSSMYCDSATQTITLHEFLDWNCCYRLNPAA